MNYTAHHEAELHLLHLTCRVERHDYSWSFVFQEVCTITVSCPWRLTRNGAVILCDADDGQQYGMPQPVDCKARANLLLDGARCVKFEMIEASADLLAEFDNRIRVETFTNSIGYESWQANFRGQQGFSLIVGTGGGGLTAS